MIPMNPAARRNLACTPTIWSLCRSNLIFQTKLLVEIRTRKLRWTSKKAPVTWSSTYRMAKTGKLTTFSTEGPALKIMNSRLRTKTTRSKTTPIKCLIIFYYHANRTNLPRKVKISSLNKQKTINKIARRKVTRFMWMTMIATFQRPVRQPLVQSSIQQIRSG